MNCQENDIAYPFVLCNLHIIEKTKFQQDAHALSNASPGDFNDLPYLQSCDRFNGVGIAEEDTFDFNSTNFQFFDRTILNCWSLRIEIECKGKAKTKEKQKFIGSQTLHIRVMGLSASKTNGKGVVLSGDQE